MIKIKSRFTYENGRIINSLTHDGLTYQAESIAPRLHPDEKINMMLYDRVMDAIKGLQDEIVDRTRKLEPLTGETLSNIISKGFRESKEKWQRYESLFSIPAVPPSAYIGVYKIDRVVFNDPATIVFWKDGTKTVVKAKNEPFDKEKGLAMAFMKKHLGNKGKYFDTIKKFTKEKDNENNA